MKKIFNSLRKSMTKKEYRNLCNSYRAVNGFNTGTRIFSDKRSGKRGANTRWAENAEIM
ncbi:MAG: hypothetical protein IKS98_13150 [Lachnospiraceae bacterium]|nr:hypothetical protein [Lachnospiraceae bacterium]